MILIVVTGRLLSTMSYLGRTLPAVVQYGSRNTPYSLVRAASVCENEDGPDGATNAICPGLTPKREGLS